MAIDATVNLLSGCRYCGKPGIEKFMRLPEMPITGAFLHTADEPEFRYPLDLYLCDTCNLVQSQHDISFASYYEDYAYTIDSSGFAKRFAQGLADVIHERWDLKPGSRVLEIGS